MLTVIAALSYGELAAVMPHAGGQYVYLREAFGPLSGFLYGWTLFLVIQTGTIAAVAVAFAKYTGVFFPVIAADHYLLRLGPLGVNTQQLLAIAVLVLLTWVNTRGMRTGAIVQNVFTVAKTGALLGLVGFGVLAGRGSAAAVRPTSATSGSNADWSSPRSAWWASPWWARCSPPTPGTTSPSPPARCAIRGATCRCRWAWAWGRVARSTSPPTSSTCDVLPLEGIQHAARGPRGARPRHAACCGPVAVQLMAAAIMISTFGCINGMTLAGARVYYAMAQDGLFFSRPAR